MYNYIIKCVNHFIESNLTVETTLNSFINIWDHIELFEKSMTELTFDP